MPIEDTIQNSQTIQITHYERLIAGKLLADKLKEAFKELGYNILNGVCYSDAEERSPLIRITAQYSSELKLLYGPKKTKEKLIELVPKTQDYEGFNIPVQVRVDNPSREGFLSSLSKLYQILFM
jgi:hypothetical protein